jgi:hypothetical protein
MGRRGRTRRTSLYHVPVLSTAMLQRRPALRGVDPGWVRSRMRPVTCCVLRAPRAGWALSAPGARRCVQPSLFDTKAARKLDAQFRGLGARGRPPRAAALRPAEARTCRRSASTLGSGPARAPAVPSPHLEPVAFQRRGRGRDTAGPWARRSPGPGHRPRAFTSGRWVLRGVDPVSAGPVPRHRDPGHPAMWQIKRAPTTGARMRRGHAPAVRGSQEHGLAGARLTGRSRVSGLPAGGGAGRRVDRSTGRGGLGESIDPGHDRGSSGCPQGAASEVIRRPWELDARKHRRAVAVGRRAGGS